MGDQDGFDFLERSLHESELDRLARGDAGVSRLLAENKYFRAFVLEAMFVAAQLARAAPRPGAKKPIKKAPRTSLVDQMAVCTSPVLVKLPLAAEGTFVEIKASILPRLKAAYPLVDARAKLAEIELMWTGTPRYRPTAPGLQACLGIWFKRAQERAESNNAYRSQGSGGSAPGSTGGAPARQYKPGGEMDPAHRAAVNERLAEEAKRRGAEKRKGGGAGAGSVIAQHFGSGLADKPK